MDLNDIKEAVGDMVDAHGASEDEVVYIIQSDGSYKPVNGFHRGEDGRIYID